MILGIPLTIWFGFLTITLLVVTFGLGIAYHQYHKPVFRFHKFFAITTIIIAFIHGILAFLMFFLGIII